ncbi:UNVERIFIED_CONTAM: hypothetical protein FKN15_004685 [Acipenser sinensis]
MDTSSLGCGAVLNGPAAQGPPCSYLRATVSEDHTAPGNLQAGLHVPSQSTGVAGASRQWNSLDSNRRPPGYRAHPALHEECLYWIHHSGARGSVFQPDLTHVLPAVETAQAPRPAQSGMGDLTASRPIKPAALGLAPERLHLSRLGLSNRVIDTLQNTRAVSTHSQYGYKWGVFQTWCLPRGFDSTPCPMAVILQFLQNLFDKGKSPSALKVYLAAISACHVKIDSSLPGGTIFERWLAASATYGGMVPHWRLKVVLNALMKPPFEPMHSAELTFLLLNAAFLLAVTSAK